MHAHVLRFKLGEACLGHSQEKATCGLGTLDLTLVHKDLFIEFQLCDLAFDVQPNIEGMKVNVDERGIHEAGDLDLKQNAGLVLALLEEEFVAALVALTNVSLRVVDTDRLLPLLLLIELAEVREHAIFLGAFLILTLLINHFLILFHTRLLRVHCFVFFRGDLFLLFDVFSGGNLELL